MGETVSRISADRYIDNYYHITLSVVSNVDGRI